MELTNPYRDAGLGNGMCCIMWDYFYSFYKAPTWNNQYYALMGAEQHYLDNGGYWQYTHIVWQVYMGHFNSVWYKR